MPESLGNSHRIAQVQETKVVNDAFADEAFVPAILNNDALLPAAFAGYCTAMHTESMTLYWLFYPVHCDVHSMQWGPYRASEFAGSNFASLRADDLHGILLEVQASCEQ